MAGASYILAHDTGTTGNKASLFDAQGALVGSAYAGYGTVYPHANQAEQDPEHWWRAVCESSRQLLAENSVNAGEIAAIGFSGQMMGCVPVDAAGKALRSCIIWADQRAQLQAAELAQAIGSETIYRLSGHIASPAYTLPKIMWLRDEQPAIFDATATFLHPKDYLAARLSGEFATDYSDASGTLAFDLRSRRWDHSVLAAAAIDESMLPPLYPSTQVIGSVTKAAAAQTGLQVGTPVVIGGGDGACAGAGAGVIDPGDAYCNIGSSAWISAAAQSPIFDPAMRSITFHHVHPQRYAPMGVM